MSTEASSSFLLEGDSPSPHSNDDSDEIDSLPSTDTHSSLDDDGDDHATSDADREWRESLQQMELLLTMVIVPYIGKYFGRKAAYWGWARFMEWKHPDIEITISDPNLFKGVGMVEAAAAL